MALLPAMDASMIYISFFCYSPYRPVLNLPYPFPLGSSLDAGAYSMHLHKPPKNLWKSAPVFKITHCVGHTTNVKTTAPHISALSPKKAKMVFRVTSILRSGNGTKSFCINYCLWCCGGAAPPHPHTVKRESESNVQKVSIPQLVAPLMALLPAMDTSMIYILFFFYSPYRPVLNCIISP